ncbi:hypothetical protein GQ600_26440 [Phytophthora cactorum]|nr:hypothetical protein GQ600_26440 [Phytophthora cactorum]
MRGLRRRRLRSTCQQKRPISLDMITVLHAFLDTPVGVKGFREGSRVWFNAVSSFAFYMEGLSLRQYYPSVVAPHEVIEYGAYALFNRKTAVAEERMYSLHHVAKDELAISAYMHLCNWMDYAFERKGHQWRDDDFVFPALNYTARRYSRQTTQLQAVKRCASAGKEYI